MPYEVEERTNKNLKDRFPIEAKLKSVCPYICDSYYLFPNPMLRTRYAKLSIPTQKQIMSICMKKIDSGRNIEEFETSVGDINCITEIFNNIFGKPKIIVEGARETYILKNATICIDFIKDLGHWTEVEVMANSLEEKTSALEQVRQIFNTLGVNINELTDKTYPEMLYILAKK